MPKTRKRFPNRFKELETIWIPMPDGTQLAARMWTPEDAESQPVPAILEFIPYRRRDFTRVSDELHHRYIAGEGYAAVRCDLRGNGDSEGIFDDEYSQQELDDGYHVIEWLAAQPWCNGSVGMMGISWGGFNCLQVAALKPPSLKAVYSVCSTDDRYADDVHYMGGCLLNDNLMWGATMTTFAMRPPDPLVVGDRWHSMWMNRLDNMNNLVAHWLRHQTRDEQWRHGSICEAYDAIDAAVYAVGGWADGYTNAIPRMMTNLSCPRKGLIGPWTHSYPWKANPKPDIDGLKDLVRWWNHWLKGIDTGMMDEPMLRMWMQESISPQTFYNKRPGRWIAEPTWPSKNIVPTRYFLNANGTLDRKPKRTDSASFVSEMLSGSTHGDWCPYGHETEMPSDQREEDGRSLCFETAPLKKALEITGAGTVHLSIISDQAQTLLYVRLCDVAPDGASTRVTYGVLNLSHREDHSSPIPLSPNTPYTIDIQLNDIAHHFKKGHRIRLAVANNAWPLVWPSPKQTSIDISLGESWMDLPTRPKQVIDRALPAFGQAVIAENSSRSITEVPYHRGRKLSRDYATGKTRIEMVKDRGRHTIEDINLTISGRGDDIYTIHSDDPLSAQSEAHYCITMKRDKIFDIQVKTDFTLTSTENDFLLTATAQAFEGVKRVFVREWAERIPRKFV